MDLSSFAARPRRRVALVATILVAMLPLSLAAQEAGDAAAGRHVAGMWCSSCHIITPTEKPTGNNGVPTFAAIAHRQSTTPASLRAFFLKPHPGIQNLHATSDEIRDLTAYIMSLSGH